MELLVVGWDGATHHHLKEYDVPYWERLKHTGKLLPETLILGLIRTSPKARGITRYTTNASMKVQSKTASQI